MFPLKPIKNLKPERSRPYAVWDIETSNWVTFVVGGIYDGTVPKFFRDMEGLLNHLFDHYTSFDLFAHFGGRFDHLFALKEALRQGNIEIEEMIPRGSSVFSFELWRGEKSLRFFDSSALFPFSLRKLTSDFNVTHKKKEFDYDKIKPDMSAKDYSKLLEYLSSDLKGLYEALEKFWSWPLIAKSGKAKTLASQSVRVLQTTLQHSISPVYPDVDRHIRQAYLGGRVEIFRPYFKSKGEKLFNYDVNSLYPHVMRENSYPDNFEAEVYEYVPKMHGIYEVVVTVPRMWLPPIGIIRKGKYIFPVGRFKAFVTSAEIKYARKLGCTFEIKRGWVFSNGGKIFKKFVDMLYKIRMESERGSADNTISKLLLNSAYGKMGQRRDRERIVFDDGSLGLRPLGEIRDVCLQVAGKTYRLMLEPIELDSFSNVAIAAFVTANARIHMHKLMRECGRELYYTDTDSLFTTRKLPTSDKLGALKLEATYQSACFLLPKTYIADEKIVMKGFEKKKLTEFTFDDFENALRGDFEGLKTTVSPKFATLKTAVRLGDLTVLTKATTRQIRSSYDKRKMKKKSNLSDWDTFPICLIRKGKKNGNSNGKHKGKGKEIFHRRQNLEKEKYPLS